MIITTLIPAMQIHLFDCKSTVPLRRGLGKNKLNLCMLVLSQLRDTYWSASVIYRLFERAQIMLEKFNSKSRGSTQPERSLASHHTGTHPGSNEIDLERQRHVHQQDTEDTNQSMPQSDLLMDGQTLPGPFWLNESGSPCFSNVDHLLSPGFFISENVFQPFFLGYDNGNGMMDAYDQMGSASNNGPIDLLYTA